MHGFSVLLTLMALNFGARLREMNICYLGRKVPIGVSWAKCLVMKSPLDISQIIVVDCSFTIYINLQGLFNGQLKHMEYLNL